MKKTKVKQIFQQFLIAVVVFSFICPGSMWAKRKGAKVYINKIDGQEIEGRLLRVRESSLLLITSTNGVTVDINEVDKIRIKRKSKAGTGLMVGLLGGAVAGSRIGYYSHYDPGSSDDIMAALAILGGVAGAVLGLLIGGMIGNAASKGYKTYQFNGKSQYNKKLLLKKLRNRARFKD